MGLWRKLFSRHGDAAPQDEAPEPRWWVMVEEEESDDPERRIIVHVVDNRVFLLGLDEMYREAMKRNERNELLTCAEQVATALKVPPADVPIEGYYVEDDRLTRYFRLMRALQAEKLERASEVDHLDEFQRLLQVTSSGMFGVPERMNLLPKGADPLSMALVEVAEWTVPTLVEAAGRIARKTDDFSLVGLGARAEDPVALAAMRESAVLYALEITASELPPIHRYRWGVEADLVEAASRFVAAYWTLFDRDFPPPEERYAKAFWVAAQRAKVIGRCVRLGHTPDGRQHYHWAVIQTRQRDYGVHEFWDSDLWTTDRYQRERLGMTDGPW